MESPAFEQQLASAHYRSLRANLLLSVLTRARTGTLTPNWRHTLALRPTEAPAAPMYRDGDQLAVREIAEIPPAAWEPHSGAGWRTALDTWFDATTDTYAVLDQASRDIQAAKRDRLLAELAAVQHLSDRLHWPEPPDIAEPPPISASPHSTHLFHIEAWYRAGLTGGGADPDWLGWLGTHPSAEASALLAKVSHPIRLQLAHPNRLTSVRYV